MATDQRRHPRYGVRLSVRYTNAEQFVTDYVENLSVGGLFIASANQLPLHSEMDVEVELPGQGTWTVRARSVFLVDPEAAKASGRTAGAGMEITVKPPGFDDALLGYLLRLGRRRDHTVMAGEILGVKLIEDAGYRVVPLEAPDDLLITLSAADSNLVAIVVPPSLVAAYRDRLGERASGILFPASGVGDIADILARIDSLL